MPNEQALRKVMKRKIKKSIREIDSILFFMRPTTPSEAYEMSELRTNKLKFQLQLNSLMLEEAVNDGERKQLEEERKRLQASLADELRNGLELLDVLIPHFTQLGLKDKAEELALLRGVRESELRQVS